MKPLRLAEITGPYGPVTIPERILQKIWWRGDFAQGDLRATDGSAVRRIRAGRWNQAEGPDFIGATLEINGKVVHGDVEVHFYAEDWQAHGHAADPAFDNVVLHLLLFPPRAAASTTPRTFSGRTPHTLVLLPHLREDIEDYAAHEALLALETRENSAWHSALLAVPEDSRAALLLTKSSERWRQKIRFARQRLDAHGWDAACHQITLETLGLKRNRAPMSTLALAHSPDAMRALSPETLYAEQHAGWHLANLRPANHPLQRLRQYRAILDAHSGGLWPADFLRWAEKAFAQNTSAASARKTAAQDHPAGASGILLPTPRFRKTNRLAPLARQLASCVFANALGGTRLHTLVVDALLPLLAARTLAPATAAATLAPRPFPATPFTVPPVPAPALYAYWHHWPLGDIPASLAEALREHLPPGDDGKLPVLCNGLFQGLLQLSHENG